MSESGSGDAVSAAGGRERLLDGVASWTGERCAVKDGRRACGGARVVSMGVGVGREGTWTAGVSSSVGTEDGGST